MTELDKDIWGRILRVFVFMPLFSTIVFYFLYPYIDPLFPPEEQNQYTKDKKYTIPLFNSIFIPRQIGTFWLKGIMSAIIIRTLRYLIIGSSIL